MTTKKILGFSVFLTIALIVLAGPIVVKAIDPVPVGPSTPVSGDGVTPTEWTDNPSCSDIGYDFGFKPQPEPPPTGTYAFPDGIHSVSITSDGTYFDWSSDLGIDAVIVKGGNHANVYVYDPEDDGDTGLSTVGSGPAISHIEFCYDYEVEVIKTADTTFTRTWEWTIEKTVTPDTWDLFTGDSGASQYTVAVTKTGYTDSAWAVSGSIYVANNTPFDALITSVSDVLPGSTNLTLDCGETFPYTLLSGDNLTCSYSADLPDGTARTNTATVTTSGTVGGGEATASVTFGEPTTVVNDSINVDDTNGGSWLFTDTGYVNYTKTFTCDDDQGENDNTATIRETGLSDDARVTVNCHALEVTKDAETSLTRTWNWTIEKGPDGEYWKFIGDPATWHEYTVSVDKVDYTDSLWAVDGTIWVYNPAPMAAVINDVTDVVSPDIDAIVDCGVTFPYTLASGGTLSCSYSADLTDASSRTNTATATLQNYAYDKDLNATPDGTTEFSGNANVNFSAPDITEVNASINVTDTQPDSTAPWIASNDDSWSYDGDFICPIDPSVYVNGYKMYTVTNTATIVQTGLSDTATVTIHCYAPVVEKDANTTYTRTYTWTIDKVGDQTDLTLAIGQQFLVNYDVTVSATPTDSDWAVAGTITVYNYNTHAAMNVSLADTISGFTGQVILTCGGSLTVPAGGSATCDYSADLPDAATRSNTATATLNGIDFTGEADVIFGDPTTEIDECIDVTDDQYGSLGTVCYSDLPVTFEYSMYVGPYMACGNYEFTNIASFVTNDTGATDSATWTVNITVPCDGCTLTPGYWKTHSEYGPAPYDDTWELMPDRADTLFFDTGHSWYQVMWTPPKGNAYYILARAYAAAYLNQLNGAYVPTEVQNMIDHAASLLDNYDGVPNPMTQIKGGVRRDFIATAEYLDDYNNGIIGPGHCSE